MLDRSINNFDNDSNELVRHSLADTIKKHGQGATVLLELPIENYFMVNAASVKFLVDNGFEGVYVSFQRPFENITHWFKQKGIDTDKLLIIDCATVDSGEKYKERSGCVNVSTSVDVDIFKQTILNSLKGLKSKNRFILIDSLTTFALYKSPSDITKLSEEIMDIIKHGDFENVVILFSVGEDLSREKYIQDITINVDEVIHVLNKSDQYSKPKEVANQGVYT